MTKQTAPDDLLDLIDRFLVEQGVAASDFGKRVMGDPCLVSDLRDGREPRRATEARIRAFIDGFEFASERRPAVAQPQLEVLSA